MKIQCDVCNKDEASLFCSADEAALCSTCDHRVHHANKLAGKHHRFSLILPSHINIPICDICQEKRAFLFCQQDRAILCKDCDLSIHKLNEHTKNHNRFLLTGVKLSPTSSLYPPALSSTSAASATDVVVTQKPLPQETRTVQNSAVSSEKDKLGFRNSNNGNEFINGVGVNYGLTSSISEYLMDTLPGWHVEDFLDASSTPFGICKRGENDVSPFWGDDLEGNNNMGSMSSENMGLWVPQAPHMVPNAQSSYPIMASSGIIDIKESGSKKKMMKSSRKWKDDGGFTVPQINPSSKRTRTLYY